VTFADPCWDVVRPTTANTSNARNRRDASQPYNNGNMLSRTARKCSRMLCQWTKALDAEVIGTVGSPVKVAVARAAGCAHEID